MSGTKDSAKRGISDLIQCGQECAEHEGGEYDGEVVLGYNLGLALFPSRAMFGLLFLCMNRRNGSGLGLFFGAGHIRLPTVNYGGRGTGNSS